MENSLIIATYNKSIWLELLLHSIARADDINGCEIVIVDDGSIDNTKEVIKSFQNKIDINYIYQENQGLAAARNTAIKAAKGELLIFLDDDRLIAKNFISSHIECSKENSNKQIVIGNRFQLFVSNLDAKKAELINDINDDLSYYKRLSRIDDYDKVTRKLFQRKSSDSPIQWISCIFANLSIKKSAFLEAGYFDTNFVGWGCEDIELGYRLYNKGYRLVLKDINNYHLEHRRSPEIPKEFIRNYNYMYSIHNGFSMKLYLDFEQGRLSLEDYEKSVTAGVLVEAKDDKGTYFKDKNVFRTIGMK